MINVIRYHFKYYCLVVSVSCVDKGESTITRGDADLIGYVCGLGRNLERAP